MSVPAGHAAHAGLKVGGGNSESREWPEFNNTAGPAGVGDADGRGVVMSCDQPLARGGGAVARVGAGTRARPRAVDRSLELRYQSAAVLAGAFVAVLVAAVLAGAFAAVLVAAFLATAFAGAAFAGAFFAAAFVVPVALRAVAVVVEATFLAAALAVPLAAAAVRAAALTGAVAAATAAPAAAPAAARPVAGAFLARVLGFLT